MRVMTVPFGGYCGGWDVSREPSGREGDQGRPSIQYLMDCQGRGLPSGRVGQVRAKSTLSSVPEKVASPRS